MDESTAKETIEFDDFAKLDLRVAKVLEASEHPNADKLLVLQVDLGDQKRQIIAGIKQFYDPEQLVGKNIVIVANLAPRKMRGLESQGMLLAAGDAQEDELRNVVVLTPDQPVRPGSTVS
jgi:methionyl-tRNA synthetase